MDPRTLLRLKKAEKRKGDSERDSGQDDKKRRAVISASNEKLSRPKTAALPTDFFQVPTTAEISPSIQVDGQKDIDQSSDLRSGVTQQPSRHDGMPDNFFDTKPDLSESAMAEELALFNKELGEVSGAMEDEGDESDVEEIAEQEALLNRVALLKSSVGNARERIRAKVVGGISGRPTVKDADDDDDDADEDAWRRRSG